MDFGRRIWKFGNQGGYSLIVFRFIIADVKWLNDFITVLDLAPQFSLDFSLILFRAFIEMIFTLLNDYVNICIVVQNAF